MGQTKTKFLFDEKVVCRHGQDYFLARCIDIKPDEKDCKYLIHYINWNDTWNEWVTEDRIFKLTVENFDRLNMDPPKNMKLPTDAELTKKQSSQLAKLNSGKWKPKSSSVSKSSKSTTSKSNSTTSKNKKSESHSKEKVGKSVTKKSADDDADVSNFLDESEVESTDEMDEKDKSLSKKRKHDSESEEASVEMSEPRQVKKTDAKRKKIDSGEKKDKVDKRSKRKVTSTSREHKSADTSGLDKSADTFTSCQDQTADISGEDKTSESSLTDKSEGDIVSSSSSSSFVKKFNVKLSSKLLYFLINDNDLISFRHSQTRLPSCRPVKNILDDFRQFVAENCPEIDVNETTKFIEAVFNSLLDNCLLYKQERSQFEYFFIQKNKATLPSEVYGGIHLLRLLAKIGKILDQDFAEHMTPEEVQQVEVILKKLLEFLELESNKSIFAQSEVYDTIQANND